MLPRLLLEVQEILSTATYSKPTFLDVIRGFEQHAKIRLATAAPFWHFLKKQLMPPWIWERALEPLYSSTGALSHTETHDESDATG